MIKSICPEIFSRTKKSKPYIIEIENTSDFSRVFTFFGFNRFQRVANYGSGVGVVYNAIAGIAYPELLAQSQRPFKAIYWDFRSDNVTNLDQNLDVYYADANEQILIDTIDLAQFFDMYALQNAKLTIEYPIFVDGSFYIRGIIQAHSIIKVLVYPEIIINTANVFKTDEGDIIEHFNEKHIISPILDNLNKLKDGKQNT